MLIVNGKRFKNILKFVWYLFVSISLVYIAWAVYKTVEIQSTVHITSTAPRPGLYVMITAAYFWWFTKFEKVPVCFWRAEKHILYAIAIRILYFCVFGLEVATSIFIMTDFDGIYLKIWTVFVGVLLFFVLCHLKGKLEPVATKVERD